MANGQQLSKENIQKFQNWIASKSDNDFRDLVNYKWQQLHRDQIAKECGFAKTALRQNPQIKSLLVELEESLRSKGILPELSTKGKKNLNNLQEYDQSKSRQEANSKRVVKLEEENLMLKAKVKVLENKLQRYADLSEVMADLGIVPR